MREYKFRAWDKKNKCWCSTEPFNIIGEWTMFDCLNQYIKKDFMNRLNDIEIIQYTGLYDNTQWEELTEEERERWTQDGNLPSDWKGKGIYEGDIVEDRYKDITGYIKYFGSRYVITYNNKIESIFNPYYNIKVIGNIYENPELLEVKLNGK